MTQTQDQPRATEASGSVINDFTINVATVNGSGSQTSNAALVQSLFHMGIPVNAKNLFPSNIKGLPTWYTIRVSARGYTARRDVSEILVAFNVKTQASDLAALPPGGVCLYPDDSRLERSRDDVTYYALPVKEILTTAGVDPKFRDRMVNMVYVGALAWQLGLDLNKVHAFLDKNFEGKTRVVESNFGLVQAAHDWCAANLTKTDPYRVSAMDETKDLILIEGNTASALGSIYGGVAVVAWYPITPATSLADALTEYLPKLRTDPATGKATFAIVQAEDELAAAGMVFGAGWGGARAMTSTSGPGISLMAEFAGFGYFAELPGVIWDVQRMGPSTGLPTRVSQGDLLSAYFLSHGDTRHPVLLPASPRECFEFGWRALSLAEQLQTPILVLSDLDLGMNLWMSEPFEYPTEPIERGKVLTAEDVKALGNKFARYDDPDGTGVGPRTYPGTDAMGAAFFTRGTGHTINATYSERPDDWKRNLDRLKRKHEYARTLVPKPVGDGQGQSLGLIAFGSVDPSIREARDLLNEQGVGTDYLRLRALPFTPEVRAFLEAHEKVVVVELNEDGQLAMLLRMEYPDLATRVLSLAHCDGLPLSGEFVAT
ncbi:MAG TPA: 2-oxoacid:acceptor oxidoreductase subunit alpha, partial [Deinococcales bacterium]|nr:2-oxoacid:acceptor oxidoreductase subunit alpha [Deinococcales bacterium]